ncbi:MAG TPA: type II toxin-antitoxin system prevent-host-death family antitoxin [bacterium]
MSHTYSAYEAKARFSELLRRVRQGQRIYISYRGREVAELRPVETARLSLSDRLAPLEEEGVLGRAPSPSGRLQPVVKKVGALARFLESRE